MISVVIPLYNKVQSIQKTLDSVLSQTYQNFEILVVDDGSTDGSAEVAEEMLKTFCPSSIVFRLIRKSNGGVSSARNEGILAAKGEYIAFLDADDLWHPEYLETLSRLIQDYPDAAIYGIGYTKLDGDEIPHGMECSTARGEIKDVWNNYPDCWTGSSSSSSRVRLIEAGMFDVRMAYGEDIDMWWRLLLSGKGVYDNKILAFYRQDTENRAMKKVIPLEKHIPYFMDKYAIPRANCVNFRRFFDREMVYILFPYLFINDYKKEARLIAKKIDYSLQKWTIYFRMLCPYMYRLYQLLKC